MAVKRTKRHNKTTLERRALTGLLIMAWAWIFGFIGVIIWQYKKSGDSATSRQEKPAVKNLIPVAGNYLNSFQAGHEGVKALLQSPSNAHAFESPLLIFTCRRPEYLSKTLKDILDNIPSPCRFGCPVIVSEDGKHPEILQVVQDYQSKFQARKVPFFHIQHAQHLRAHPSAIDGYKALSHHYSWALSQVFRGKIHTELPVAQRVIILEEDIHTAPDFFSYMEATSTLLDQDSSLIAVSAFNDNGHMVKDPKRLLRSDFFPGLGWMMTRKLWIDELEAKWPPAYWDDWLRDPAQRKGRQVIRPEISRTFHFGSKGGTSSNQFGGILDRVQLNQEDIDWKKENLSYLQRGSYDKQYASLIAASKRVTTVAEAMESVQTQNTWLEYTDFDQFHAFAGQLKIMDDEKAMVPRTAYKGVVEVRPLGENILFLTPPIRQLQETITGFD